MHSGAAVLKDEWLVLNVLRDNRTVKPSGFHLYRQI
jgi:hypothetical protein